jgi:hypothetical protein
MLEYVRKAKERYTTKQINTEGFIAEIWEGIKDSAKRSNKQQHIVEKATKAFLQLFEENKHLPINGKDILQKAGIKPNQTSNHGLWPWLKKNDNADVIKQEKDESGKRCYSVPNNDFYTALRKVVLGLRVTKE